jgi:hypothetical protein
MATPPGGDDLGLDADSHPTVVISYGEPPAHPAAADGTGVPTGAVGGRRARRLDGGRRAARLTPSPLGRAVVPIALALVSAVALAAAWARLQDTPGTLTAVPAAVTPSLSPVPTPGGSVAPSPTAPLVARPSAAAPSAARPTPSATPTSVARDRSMPVVVLNATRRQGLAARVAARLRADGWRVVAIGNWTRGGVGGTTAYLVGHARAGATMRHDIPTAEVVGALRPGMRARTLTLVVGPDYPS